MEKLLTIIDGPRLVSCNFATREIKKTKSKEIAINLSSLSKFQVDNKKKTAIISWTIQSNTANVPFKFDVEVEALFKLNKPATEKEIIQEGRIEAGPILFVLLREMVADFTRKAGLSPFHPSFPDFSKFEGMPKKGVSFSKKKNTSSK